MLQTPNTLPEQLIPESQKNEDWIIKNLRVLKSYAMTSTHYFRRDFEAWCYFHNIWNEEIYSYLTEFGNSSNNEPVYALPARLRHIPIQRSKLDVLISRQKLRPFNFSIYATDNESINTKFQSKINNYIDLIDSRLYEKHSQLQLIEQDYESKKQEIYNVISQQPQTEEQANQIQQVKMQLPMIISQIEMAKHKIQKADLITKKDLDNLDRYYKYKVKDYKEELAQKILFKLRQELDIERKSNVNFVSHIVTGKQAYYVDYEQGNKYPKFETLNSSYVYFPATEKVTWIQDGDWVIIEDRMSKGQVIDEFNLTAKEIEQLDELHIGNSRYTKDVLRYYDKFFNQNIYSGSYTNMIGIPVYRIFFRSPNRINVKKSLNPYDSKNEFIHFMDSDNKIVNNGQLKFDGKKKKYIHKETLDEYDVKDVISENKGEKLEYRYIDDVYQGVVIGDNIFKNLRKREVRNYDNENYSRTELPVYGKAFNSFTDRPRSLIWDTKDLQILYNIISYHRELYIAVSGVKGTIMDKAQIPEGMSIPEWRYLKKMGTQLIETVRKSGRVNPAYNQFGTYDDTISPSIQYLDRMLEQIDNTCGNIIGVPRAAQGQIVESDQVGTFTTSVQQSNLTTEIIFAEHDEIERKALKALLKLTIRYCLKDNDIFSIINPDFTSEAFMLPATRLDEMDLDIYLMNGNLEEKKLKDIKQLAMQQQQTGLYSFKQILSIINIDSLKELEKQLEFFADEAEEMASKNASDQQQFSMESQERLLNLKAQLDGQLKQQDLQIKQLESQLKSESEKVNLELEKDKLEFEKIKWNDEKELRILDISSEREIEGQYLTEQKRSSMTDEYLNSIQLQLDALLSKANIQVAHKKIDVDKMKTSTKTSKEKIV